MRKWKWLTKKWAKPAIVTGIALIVVAGCIIGYTAYASNGTVTTITTFRKAKAETGNISTSISGSGTVSSSGEYALTAANDGTVDTLKIKQGDSVTAGEVIAHITSSSTQQQVTQKQNALTSAQSSLTQAEQNLASGQYIKSPIAGRVKSVTVSSGDDLSITKSVGSLMVISTDGKMNVSLSGDGLPASGKTVNVAVTTYNGGTVNVSGTITSASLSGSSGDSTGNGGSGGSNSSSVVAQINRDDLPVGAAAVVSYNGHSWSGKLELDSSVEISNPGNGTVNAVNVSENSTVSKGSNLVTLNAGSLQNAVTSAQQQVTNAESDLASAQAQANKVTITSPVNGVVASVSTSVGATIQNGGAIATILQNNAMQTVVTVDETDISKIKVGQKAETTLDAISGKTFSGTVKAVDVMGTNSNGVTNFNVTVSIDNPTGVRVGETTSVSLITEEKDNTVVLSANAVLEKRGTSGYVLDASKIFGSSSSVTLNNVSTQELIQKYGKRVTIGLSTSNQVEITDGLSDGDEVAVPITINKAAVQSLSASRSSSSQSMGFGGMEGGYGGGTFGGGMEGGGTFGGTRSNRTGGTGNTTSKG